MGYDRDVEGPAVGGCPSGGSAGQMVSSTLTLLGT
jgi:hypothetical protein